MSPILSYGCIFGLLVILSGCGGDTEPVNSNIAPSISFTGEQSIVNGNDFLLNSGADDPDGDNNQLEYLWEQTGGSQTISFDETSANLSFTAPNNSVDENYSFSLTVTDSGGAEVNDTFTLLILSTTPPSISLTGASEAGENSLYALTANADDLDGDNNNLTYAWSQTAGTQDLTFDNSTSNLSVTTPLLNIDEIYTFSLTVTDEDGFSVSDSFSVLVKSTDAPTVSISGASSVNEGQAYIATSIADDIDGDNSAITYAWSKTAGSQAVSFDSSAVDLSFTAPTVANDETYTFSLTITDEDNFTNTETFDVEIISIDPPTIDSFTSASLVAENQSYSLAASVNDPDGENSNITYAWRQTSGNQTIISGTNTNASPSFTAPDVAGDEDYTFELTIKDEDLYTATDTFTLTVGRDFDSDGDPDLTDLDDDNDGTNDASDDCPFDNTATAQSTYYEDIDGDGLGDALSSALYCPDDLPTGWVVNNTDPVPTDPFNNIVMLVDDDSAIALGRAVEMSDDGLVLAVAADGTAVATLEEITKPNQNLQIFRRLDRTMPFAYSDKEFTISHNENRDADTSPNRGWNGNELAISLSGDGNVLVVGERNQNRVRVFTYDNLGGSWSLADTIERTDLDETAYDHGFGTSVTVNETGNYIAVSTNLMPYIATYDGAQSVVIVGPAGFDGTYAPVNTGHISGDTFTLDPETRLYAKQNGIYWDVVYSNDSTGWYARTFDSDPAAWVDAESLTQIGLSETIDNNAYVTDSDGIYVPNTVSNNVDSFVLSRGRVAVFHSSDLSSNSWLPKTTLSDGTGDNDNYGSSISFTNDARYLLVGANQVENADTGKAYLYSRDLGDNTIWTIQQTFTPTYPEEDSGYATRVKISANGNIVFISSYRAALPDNFSTEHGSLEIYKYNNLDSWDFVQLLQDTDSGIDTPYFGLSLDTSFNGEQLIVGSVDFNPVGGNDIGRAYLFEYNNGDGLWQMKFKHSPDPSEINNSNARYGAGVAISSDGAAYAIGARGHRYNAGNVNEDAGSVWSNAPD
ncbi:hypothetical protein LNL84_05425 [Vibrio sp. ZSDZ34]|uniref:PKD/Chitinase domain-containing protein n=1 Tax=Vibrio gelatinilyticus TaxID=2893468 RepID=A0A9X2AVK2_9VIBR|nr:REJ domain-containing protein [Vibrio gelatinilyticus]MCJ2376271.1 hypothetical protein [Vibrio gelatinilyticus]